MSGPAVSRRGFLTGASAVAIAAVIPAPREPYFQGVVRQWGGAGLFPMDWAERFNGLGYRKFETMAKIFADVPGLRIDPGLPNEPVSTALIPEWMEDWSESAPERIFDDVKVALKIGGAG